MLKIGTLPEKRRLGFQFFPRNAQTETTIGKEVAKTTYSEITKALNNVKKQNHKLILFHWS